MKYLKPLKNGSWLGMSEVEVKEIPNGYHITFLGDPIAWSAPTFSRKGAYDKKWKQKRDAILLLKEKEYQKLDGFLTIMACFFMRAPKSMPKKRKKDISTSIIPHIGHKDRSNMLKFIEDILQSADMIDNDCTIWNGQELKVLALEGKTEVIIVQNSEISCDKFLQYLSLTPPVMRENPFPPGLLSG